jgi:uncharacterized membrane protein YecN with MAPEG domain
MTLQTAWIGAPLVMLIGLLGLRVSGLRISGRARRDDKATHEGFQRWQRAHGNAVEHVPVVLLLLLVAELIGANAHAVTAVGVTFLVSRVLHAIGTAAPHRWSKFTGAALTYLVELGLGVLLVATLAGVR